MFSQRLHGFAPGFSCSSCLVACLCTFASWWAVSFLSGRSLCLSPNRSEDRAKLSRWESAAAVGTAIVNFRKRWKHFSLLPRGQIKAWQWQWQCRWNRPIMQSGGSCEGAEWGLVKPALRTAAQRAFTTKLLQPMSPLWLQPATI